MRLFIAIKLSDEMISALEEFQDRLREIGIEGNYSPRDNLHVTLAFVGEYNHPDEVLDVMDSVEFQPYEIGLFGVGCFRDLYWTGLAENRQLEGYVRRLRKALSDNGIPFDRKRFKPHITLIRKASYRYGESLPSVEAPDSGMTVERISLMKSERGKHGMIYTEIGSVEGQGFYGESL